MVTSDNPVSPAGLRTLLRKLRDADLHKRHIAITGKMRVSIEGCLSLDSPVEQALRYLLRWPDGSEEVLWLAAEGQDLGVWLSDPYGKKMGQKHTIALFRDENGRATAPAWRARVDPKSAGTRELGHFLRRLVRGLFNPKLN
ncbi:MAG: hypothetical protein ACI8TQ_001752 [Planctomycetota bacterium]|jgi:hypothetical protein